MNPLLLLNLAGAIRDDMRKHPLRWKLFVVAPLLVVVFGCVMVLGGALIVTLSWGSGGDSATPSHVAGIPGLRGDRPVRWRDFR
ncbi:hypothetical protein QRX50_20225 [Amycolatopsis carbonis]|uniref:Uncharacterized protein n=1 Tax=Amycolatopsis carbonis TaxID=715471 RepID=A0A9Y2IM85_9PSEU|nr:hypothetical protein [Amycolatopsis sp. 2-15]WIX82925.1 hypothetical protein QRX50_20225 [Amycolatopsis sp. 2-15]